MKKFPLIAIVATLAIIIGGVFLVSKSSGGTPSSTPPPKDSTSYEYFWGEGCPHCAVVDEFMKTWSGKDNIKIDKKEVWYNKANSFVFADRAAKCGLKKDELAVPMLVTPDNKCLTGDTPIIDHFKSLDAK